MNALPPPSDTEAEKALLGSCLIPGGSSKWVALHVEIEAFYSERHRDIAKAVYAIVEEHGEIDPITVHAKLSDAGKSGDVGGLPYLMALVHSVSTTDHVEYYAKIVQKHYYDREIFKASQKMAQAIQEADSVGVEYALSEQAKWHRMSASVGEIKALTLKESMINLMCAIDENKTPEIIRFGIGSIDDITGGARRGHLWTIGARPRIGKTATLATIGVAVAKTKRVGFFSAEMSGDEISLRILSSASGVKQWRLHRNRLESQHITDAHAAAVELSTRKFFYNEIPSPRLEDIRKFAEQLKLDVLIVDYLTRCTMPFAKDERVGVNRFMKGIKNIAREGFLVLLGAQVNRNADRESDRAPLLSDLKESSAIEEESDGVILLHSKREDLDNQELDTIDIQFHIAKNRHGKMGKVLLPFQRDILRLGEKDNDGPTQRDFKIASTGERQEDEQPF